MINDPIMRAVALACGLDPASISDEEMDALMDGRAEIKFELDQDECCDDLVATIVFPS